MLFNKKCCCDRQMGFGNFGPQAYDQNQMGFGGNMGCPIIEPAINKCVEKEFFHEVPHVC